MKNTIRLTESELKSIITESVKNVLKEDYAGIDFDNFDDSNEWDDEYNPDVQTLLDDGASLNNYLFRAKTAMDFISRISQRLYHYYKDFNIVPSSDLKLLVSWAHNNMQTIDAYQHSLRKILR